MRDLLQFVNPRSAHQTFGVKIVVLGGDFCQILPVVPKGTREDIVAATINASYLWDNCKVLRLTKNLRLKSMSAGTKLQWLENFAKWIAGIGDGTIGCLNDGLVEVDIPPDMLLPSSGDPIATVVENTFPMFSTNNSDNGFLENRAILATTLDVVNAINQYMSDMHVAESKDYSSCDMVCSSESNDGILTDVHKPEFLNGIRTSGIPNHSLTLKVDSPVMLLRNIDHSLGLCNSTRLIVTPRNF
ncbi:PREDICTED: uncharacterized protein LOC109190188 [Ipomoea nil]|uniref:uncharacterized protein LOC109190188 n=1 Tax=Ipomoea nil TaxID=35883 RepID=UPI000901CCF6|nr:PREDICTED: uncharacterized protein LOC109190188 [Ipomoea nil]